MKICLLTPGQPSTNPRLVKEADALAQAGFDVTVVHAYWVQWACKADRELLSSRSWRHIQVGGDPSGRRSLYWLTRIRHGMARSRWFETRVPVNWSASRVSPELTAAAKQIPANLYIAHNLGALPAAVAGAKNNGGLAAFDLEDLYTAMTPSEQMRRADTTARQIESTYLPQCAYVTAASPGIADDYVAQYRIPRPLPILNVFPRAERRAEFRPTDLSGRLTLYWFSQTIGFGRGIEDAVGAMGILGCRNVTLYIQGEWAPGYRRHLYADAEKAGLYREQVVHLGPELPSKIVHRASTFDVGLALEPGNSKNSDLTISNKLFTYVLAGNAIAATATSGQKAIIARIAPGGFAYEAGDVEELARRLDRWRSNRLELETARRASWDWGTREYNWDIEKTKLLKAVHGVLNPVHAGNTVRCGLS